MHWGEARDIRRRLDIKLSKWEGGRTEAGEEEKRMRVDKEVHADVRR